ncbi:TetR/AcrR family transcriptional regulator C-terminal domain-containing protein [Longispora sp. NPDC051575]|uniref:TetR/AcrR family transcriptional regulator n=1 Tax=Longispora sp. NPDC051575 TaxID=3154943 RepID=UPI0034259966
MAAQRGLNPSRDSIAEAAVALVDREGPDALTMRRLADHIGIPVMTMQRTVGSRDELLDAMVDRVTLTIADVPDSGEWHEQFASLFVWLHDVMTTHPGLVRLRLSRPFLSPGVVRLAERGLALLAGAGFTPEEAIIAYRSTYLHTLGCAAYVDHLDPAAAQQRTRTALAALPPAQFPYLTDHLDTVVPGVSGNAAFEFGLANLIDGLRRSRA